MRLQNKAKPLKAMSKEGSRYAFHTAQLAVRDDQAILETSNGRILARTVIEATEEDLDQLRKMGPVFLTYSTVQEWQKGGDLILRDDGMVTIRKGPGETIFPTAEDIKWPATDELFEGADKNRKVTLTLGADLLHDLAAAIGPDREGLLSVTIFLGKPAPGREDGTLPAHNVGAYRVEVIGNRGTGIIMPITI